MNAKKLKSIFTHSKAVKDAAQNGGGVSRARKIFTNSEELSLWVWRFFHFSFCHHAILCYKYLIIPFIHPSVHIEEIQSFQHFSISISIRQIMRFDTSMENLVGIGRSESFADLNFAKNIIGSSSNLMSTSGDCRYHYHDDDLFNSKTEEGKKFSSIFHFFSSIHFSSRQRQKPS